jgi:hypothetical protein
MSKIKSKLAPEDKGLWKIEWKDIVSDASWVSKTDFDNMEEMKCINIGYIYSSDFQNVKIYSSYSVDEKGIYEYSNVTVIPTSVIISKTKL